jgi:hypothetical protein
MTHYSIDIKSFRIKAYESEATAKIMANGCLIFSNIDEMLDNPNVTLTTFANMFNANSPATVKRFADKKSAAKRLFNLVEELDIPVREEEVKKTPQVDALPGMAPLGIAETADVKKARAVAKARQILAFRKDAKKRNPRHELVGKVIRSTVRYGTFFNCALLSDGTSLGYTKEQLESLHNPRKKDTKGYVSHQILIDNQKEDKDQWMDFELYTSLGGRLEDARWDIKKGWVEVKD